MKKKHYYIVKWSASVNINDQPILSQLLNLLCFLQTAIYLIFLSAIINKKLIN